ncbi:MAG TPA: RiPP maturation radical SAM C-methyltransferase [Pyrinomonadaceae bacterium]|nr:RiPP maturation radical SAM C-methyltransferase [Pyrinomonadaceae bacterium]
MTHKHDLSTVLVSMPWATTSRPSLSLSILSSNLKFLGHQCEVLYPNIYLSAVMGCNGYEYLAGTPALFGVAEHLFAVDVFGKDALESERYLSNCALTAPNHHESPESLRASLFILRDRIVPNLIEMFVEEILRRKADVVGFTCTFNQVMPSVALARRLKESDPNIHTILGGPCVHGEMGITYARIFKDYVDAVFLGDADQLLADYLSELRQGNRNGSLAGIAAGANTSGDALLFENLNGMPVPDFGDYFASREELANEKFELAAFHSVPFEASRGCWWGEKHHCTFCGLNNRGMRYRRKSVEKVVEELTSLAEKHGVSSFMAADNILDYQAYDDLLPALASIPADLRFFFEIKANVRRRDVEKLVAAGVTWVQPGFESFSDHVLKLMRKGTTAFQNIQALKWLCEFGVEVSYNLLVGFPGETDEDYEGMLRLLPKLFHLPSPGPEANVAQVQRFAPFHFDNVKQGIGAIRGDRYYDYLIPPSVANSNDYAYFFEREIDPESPLERYLPALDECLTAWFESTTKLSLHLGAGNLDLITVKETSRTSSPLSKLESAILVLADELTSERSLVDSVLNAGLGSRKSVLTAISDLDERALIARADGLVLSLIPFAKSQATERLNQWLRAWCGIEQPQRRAAENDLVQLFGNS